MPNNIAHYPTGARRPCSSPLAHGHACSPRIPSSVRGTWTLPPKRWRHARACPSLVDSGAMKISDAVSPVCGSVFSMSTQPAVALVGASAEDIIYRCG